MFGQGFNSGFFIVASGANTFASENFNTVLYTGTGSSQRIGGHINRGAVFNGSSSYIDIPLTSLFGGKNTLSVSLWFKTTTTTRSRIFTDYAQTSRNCDIILDSNGTIEVTTDYNQSSNLIYNSTTAYNDDNWHHIVVSLNQATSQRTIYIDGSLVNTGTLSSNSWSGSGQKVSLGVFYSSSSGYSQYFDGKIDQLRIFDKALSSSEVTTLYGETFASTTVSTTDIFDDNSGVALYQLDGNANDTGGTSGKFGSAAIYSGNNGNITINNFPTLTQVGISMWVNIPDISAQFALISRYGLIGSTDDREFSIYTYQGTLYAIIYYNGNNGNAVSISTSSYLSNNTWHHIAFTSDGSTQPKLYIDGVQRGTAQSNNNSYYSSSQPVLIGAFSASSAYNLTGRIDQVRIYDTALSSTDVSNLYAETASNTSTLSFPSGKTAIATYKLDGTSIDLSEKYDGADTNITYAYDGTATNVTYEEATKFQPDFVWIKKRTDDTKAHRLFDSVRGAGNVIYSNLTNAEASPTDELTSFDSNGFTVGSASAVNDGDSADSFVAWCFNAGTGNATTNNNGSVASTVKANTKAGFSVVKFTTNLSSGQSTTVGHGLSAAPEIIIQKNLGNSYSWWVSIDGISGFSQDDYLSLNSTQAKTNIGSSHPFGRATSTVFSISEAFSGSGTQNQIAYCFHSVDGYQRIGTYAGNGSASGPIVETGFEPAFVMIKNTNGADSWDRWYMSDNKRLTDGYLYANENLTEAPYQAIKILSNGFEVITNDTGVNESSNTYIYLAIAADPDTTIPTVENSFDVVTYTGTGSTQSIALDFKPDLIWFKNRDTTDSSAIVDTIRGIDSSGTQYIASDSTSAEATSTNMPTSVESNGFTLSGGGGRTNTLNENYVAWCWKAADHDNNLPQINTEGTIDSIVSVNAAAGFSIVKYTGGNSASDTVGHGLTDAEMIILKDLNDGTHNWRVWHKDLSANNWLYLNLTNAQASAAVDGGIRNVDSNSFGFINGTTQGVQAVNNSSNNYIAYVWKSISGYSKIGNYTGTGSTQAITGLGFAPRFVMIKNTSDVGNWIIHDNVRFPSNPSSGHLRANTNAAEDTGVNERINFDSNGFTITGTGQNVNHSDGDTYIYLAIA